MLTDASPVPEAPVSKHWTYEGWNVEKGGISQITVQLQSNGRMWTGRLLQILQKCPVCCIVVASAHDAEQIRTTHGHIHRTMMRIDDVDDA